VGNHVPALSGVDSEISIAGVPIENQKEMEQRSDITAGPRQELTEVRVKGKNRLLPSLKIRDRTVVFSNGWPRLASVKDEDFIQGEPVDDPAAFVAAIKRCRYGADIFTFAQKFPDTRPKHAFRMEWDNVAAIPLTSYQHWLEEQITGNMRKILRRSSRRGISVGQVDFTDEFVRGVVEIYNESPVRQNRSFWHYGKTFDTIKLETGTYLERSVFLGAFFEGNLVGFIKLVFVDRIARLMQIVSMISHSDKMPTNALIAKAVEISADRGCTHLTYGKYIYGKMGYTSLTEFKVRNGFERFLLPRYYLPLTVAGEMAIKLRMHRGIKELMPGKMMRLMASVRAGYIIRKSGRNGKRRDQECS